MEHVCQSATHGPSDHHAQPESGSHLLTPTMFSSLPLIMARQRAGEAEDVAVASEPINHLNLMQHLATDGEGCITL